MFDWQSQVMKALFFGTALSLIANAAHADLIDDVKGASRAMVIEEGSTEVGSHNRCSDQPLLIKVDRETKRITLDYRFDGTQHGTVYSVQDIFLFFTSDPAETRPTPEQSVTANVRPNWVSLHPEPDLVVITPYDESLPDDARVYEPTTWHRCPTASGL